MAGIHKNPQIRARCLSKSEHERIKRFAKQVGDEIPGGNGDVSTLVRLLLRAAQTAGPTETLDWIKSKLDTLTEAAA